MSFTARSGSTDDDLRPVRCLPREAWRGRTELRSACSGLDGVEQVPQDFALALQRGDAARLVGRSVDVLDHVGEPPASASRGAWVVRALEVAQPVDVLTQG